MARRTDTLPEALDSVLRERLRAVLDREPVTEPELRQLAEDGRACALILSGRLEYGQRRLAELASDPTSSLAEIAGTLRSVHELGPHLMELQALLSELEDRARELRASWLSTQAGVGHS
jgi:hypothetical protein